MNIKVEESPFVIRENSLLLTDEERFTCLGTGKSGKLSELKKEEFTIPFPVYSETGRRIIQANHLAQRYFMWEGNREDACKDYLKEKRNFSEADRKTFGLGFSGPYGTKLLEYLVSQGVPEEIALAAGLAKEKDGYLMDTFWNRVTIPIRNADGYIVAFGGRILTDGKCKYINTVETEVFKKGDNLFMYKQAKEAECKAFILCEGYMDVLTMHKHGFTNAVASLGTALTENQTVLLLDKPNLYFMYDGDEAGIKATLRAIPMVKNKTVKVVSLAPYKDPDEFLNHESVQALCERFKKAVPAKEFVRSNYKEADEKLLDYLISA